MEDLFRSYWWLLFPLSWFVIGGWQSWLNYRKHRDSLDIIRRYADSGKDIPPGLIDKLGTPSSDDDSYGYSYSGRRGRRYYGSSRSMGGWPNVVLFFALSAGFGYASWTDLYGAGEAFTIVAFVMGAVGLATLVATLTNRTPKD